jgi:L-iditol 2-dehydrogenase
MMKASIFYGPQDMRLENVPIPAIADNELLLKVAACAICGSDVRTYHHGARNIHQPVTLGHEATGTIVQVGKSLTGFSPGQRVAVAPAIPCTECSYCQRGIQTMCDNLQAIGYEFHGGFADYMVVPYSAVKAGCVNDIPDNLSFEEATLAEPLACAINGQELLNVGMGDTVVIIGAGPMGCLHAELAKIRGAMRVMMVEVQQQRLDLARQFAVDVLIDGEKENVTERVLQETKGMGASVVIVAAPSAAAQALALTLAAKQARVSFFGGLPKTDPMATLNVNLIHYREIFVVGAYGSKPRHNRLGLEILASGRISASKLIGMVVPLERIEEGITALKQGKILKVIVTP